MTRDLDADLKTLRTVLEFAQNRDFVRAAALAEQTLADGFEHPTEPPASACATAGMGHENQFPPTNLSARYRISQETFAGT